MTPRVLSILRRAAVSSAAAARMLVRATVVSTVVELLGLAAVVYGVGLIYQPAAFILGGLFLVLIGVAIDPPAPRKGTE